VETPVNNFDSASTGIFSGLQMFFYGCALAGLVVNAWLDWRTSYLSDRLNWIAASSFALAVTSNWTLELMGGRAEITPVLSSGIVRPIISFWLYYGLYRAKLFYFGDVKYASVLAFVCLTRAGPLEFLSAQIISLSLVMLALGYESLRVNRMRIKSTEVEDVHRFDVVGGSLTGLVEIRAGPFLLLGHLLAVLGM
jgi:hypothetical protein